MTQDEIQRMFADAIFDMTGGTKFGHLLSVSKARAWMSENEVTPTPCAGPGAQHQRAPRSAYCNPHYQQLQYYNFDETRLTVLVLREKPTTTISAQVPLWVYETLVASDPHGKYMHAARVVYTELATGFLRKNRGAAPDVGLSTPTKQVSIMVGETLAKAVQSYTRGNKTIHEAGARVLIDWACGALARRQG